jgi:hypothetical protein
MICFLLVEFVDIAGAGAVTVVLIHVFPFGFFHHHRFFPPFRDLFANLFFVAVERLDEGIQVFLLVRRAGFPELDASTRHQKKEQQRETEKYKERDREREREK